MVNISWITDKISRKADSSSKKEILYELDKNKEGIAKLEELTEQLEKLEFDKHRSEEYLKLITNGLDIALWAKDIEGRFLFLNDACANTILRTTVDEAMHLTDEDFEHDALASVCMESDRKVMHTTTTMRFIEHARYHDHDLWLDVIKSPLFVKGKLVGITGMAKDITNLVSDTVKDSFTEVCSVEIDINAEYCSSGNGRRSGDLRVLLEKNKMENGC